MSANPYSELQRQSAAAKQLLEAKILEFAAHQTAGHMQAAERPGMRRAPRSRRIWT